MSGFFQIHAESRQATHDGMLLNQLAEVQLALELWGNIGQLEQALVALFVNAVEAMSRGDESQGGTLTVRLVSGDQGTVGFEIADTGVGIPSEIRQQIFEPFFSTKGEQSGVGLGLAVVYGIVQSHGGRIDVESELGQGTLFRILKMSRFCTQCEHVLGHGRGRKKRGFFSR